MKRRLRLSLGVLLLLAVLHLAQTDTAEACQCGQPLREDMRTPTARDFAEGYDAVFQGRVLGIGDEPGTSGGARVLFEVTKSWKGLEKSQVIILTGSPWGSCGYRFSLWQSYLVFADAISTDGELVTNICSPTAPLGGDRASHMTLELGAGKAPTQIVQLENPNSFMANLPMLMAAGLIVAMSVALVVKQRRRTQWHKQDSEH